MGKTVGLVACVGKKRERATAARDLYVSPWFLKASRYAEQVADQWYILSALYGLTVPKRKIKPYDVTLNRMPAAERRAWAEGVVQDLGRVVKRGDRVVILAGQRYREGLIEPLRQMGCRVEVPMEGLGIGQQLGWLKERVG